MKRKEGRKEDVARYEKEERNEQEIKMSEM